MRLVYTFLVMLALFSPLRATWERPGIARLSWHGAGCLWKDDTFYRCYDASGVLLLGGTGPLDGRHRPRANDVFRLVRSDGTEERARLIGRVYLAVWR